MRRLGGTARVWRTDRLATVIVPGSRDVQPSFAPVAKHYGAVVEPCPPRRGNRKGAVESAVRFTCGRWWRTMTATTPEEAQAVAGPVPRRPRRRPTSAAPPPARRTDSRRAGDAEPLLALPAAAFPATIEVTRIVAANATVAFRGNRYSVPPGLTGVELHAAAPARARHRRDPLTRRRAAGRAPARAGRARAPSCAPPHTATPSRPPCCPRSRTARPCDRKANRPPGAAALAEAARAARPRRPRRRRRPGPLRRARRRRPA